MSFGPVSFVIAQIAAGSTPGEPRQSGVSPAPQAIASANATARVVQPVRIRFDKEAREVVIDAAPDQKPQSARDETGTLWIEFS